METEKEARGVTPQIQLDEEDVPLETSVYHSIKVSNLNSFLFPWLLSFKPGRHRSRIDQRRRAQRIGVFMHTSDIVILQECWGSQVGIIQRCLDHHKVIPNYESHNLCGLFENTMNNIRCYLRDQGGLWSAYNSRMKLLYFAKRTFTLTETSRFRGCHAYLLDMDEFWRGKHLLVINAHLDCKDRMKQRQQMQELHTYLGEFIQEIKIANPDFAFRQCGVVLAGDFNSPSYSTNYHHLIDLFAARDLYKEYIVKHHKDEKPSYDPSSNSLIDKDSFPERIDYIFGLDRFVAEEPEFSSNLASKEELKLMPLEAIKFHIQTQTHGEELGDHWPLSADIVPRENVKK